jgi:addiction module RelE/StbE family toxin
MRALVWTPSFARALKRRIRRQPDLHAKVEQTLRQLAEDPFHPSLYTHKLKGPLAGTWACSIGFDLRILFDLVRNAETGTEEVLLLTIGSHDEVY